MQRLWILRRLAAVLAIAMAIACVATAQNTNEDKSGSVVMAASIEGPIGPATVKHVHRVVGIAQERRAAALLLRLNTPGGLADAMRQVISEILQSTVPVVGYVAPSGAHAASAGTYILYATHVAAMAPGTNLGAATPVQLGGLPDGFPGSEREPAKEETNRPDDADAEGDQSEARKPGVLGADDAMTAKATNDAVALIRSLAELHGRNADWAETAVREAASLSAAAALERNVIDFMASDTDALLNAVHGRTVTVAGSEHRIEVKGLPVETIEMDAVTRILSVLSNPNVALILMMVGVYGLIFEFWNPGALVPGVVGAISLTLGLYALNQLPLDYAGLALIGLGIAFMVVEALTPTFGVLGIGGLVAFVFGSSMLIDTDAPQFQISVWLIGTMAALSGAVLVLLLGFTFRAYRRAPVSGHARMVGAPARVIEWSGGKGYVWTEGERWQARGDAVLTPGQTVTVRAVHGLTLVVETSSREIAQPAGKG
ncbi:NfeD family protein [Pseudooceanicola lipolyticus]|nr:nodulation protein NfeD [Pseudooceanicola lipolyticus]